MYVVWCGVVWCQRRTFDRSQLRRHLCSRGTRTYTYEEYAAYAPWRAPDRRSWPRAGLLRAAAAARASGAPATAAAGTWAWRVWDGLLSPSRMSWDDRNDRGFGCLAAERHVYVGGLVPRRPSFLLQQRAPPLACGMVVVGNSLGRVSTRGGWGVTGMWNAMRRVGSVGVRTHPRPARRKSTPESTTAQQRLRAHAEHRRGHAARVRIARRLAVDSEWIGVDSGIRSRLVGCAFVRRRRPQTNSFKNAPFSSSGNAKARARGKRPSAIIARHKTERKRVGPVVSFWSRSLSVGRRSPFLSLHAPIGFRCVFFLS